MKIILYPSPTSFLDTLDGLFLQKKIIIIKRFSKNPRNDGPAHKPAINLSHTLQTPFVMTYHPTSKTLNPSYNPPLKCNKLLKMSHNTPIIVVLCPFIVSYTPTAKP